MLAFAPLDAASEAAAFAVTHLATFLAPVGATSAAIVVFTILVRLLLHPLTRAAVRGEKARVRLAPEAAKLRKKYADKPMKAAEELTALYKREGVSQFAGLLPMLAQAPFFLVMYRIFAGSSFGGHANALLTHELFGVPLASRFVGSPHLWVFGVLFAALTALAFVASRRAAAVMAASDPVPTGWMARLSRILPYGVVATALFVPLAAGLYLLTTTAWTAAENALLRRGLPEVRMAVAG